MHTCMWRGIRGKPGDNFRFRDIGNVFIFKFIEDSWIFILSYSLYMPYIIFMYPISHIYS